MAVHVEPSYHGGSITATMHRRHHAAAAHFGGTQGCIKLDKRDNFTYDL
ncbi:MAG TPA: hypothetical protein IAA88_06860 [Candidatus Avimuribaculum pullicola]|nr:hypothetical protein [Candidatus Avimuribaculum pullicola]